ncbi:fibronectin type III-like domain-contianing protein [Arthrobacter sp. ISL-30]|uniref:fibronectin type III-like domain-contianing protein n=1 Tax=Arthrobacter sp. ISL-30 TaxID=2819109 RepID=UPI001BE8C91D|nr:fibronectin type III-like domain-contianing protein [Arthrobacter sp. ISL-30]MBT2512487.1 fibronectin type III-like domain-contianing protein [Arthrobacter sp. ISL-30]
MTATPTSRRTPSSPSARDSATPPSTIKTSRVLSENVAADGRIGTKLTLTDTGNRPALETVQVYVADLITSVTWAERELKSFTKVHIMPGQTVDVELSLPAESCSLVDQNGHASSNREPSNCS